MSENVQSTDVQNSNKDVVGHVCKIKPKSNVLFYKIISLVQYKLLLCLWSTNPQHWKAEMITLLWLKLSNKLWCIYYDSSVSSTLARLAIPQC